MRNLLKWIGFQIKQFYKLYNEILKFEEDLIFATQQDSQKKISAERKKLLDVVLKPVPATVKKVPMAKKTINTTATIKDNIPSYLISLLWSLYSNKKI